MQENLSLKDDEILLLSRHAEDRSRIYLLLSAFYMQRPRDEFVRKIKSDEFIQNLKNALSEDESKMKFGISDGLKILDMFINSIKDMPEPEVAENLAVDFTRLFRGIKKGYGPPPPYESVWRGEGKVMGEWAQKVLENYYASGIGMDMEDELPDYIGIELKFMAILSYHEKERYRGHNIQEVKRFVRIQQEFMNEHIQQWIPEFCNRVAEEATSSFYKGCALLTKGFLEIDMEKLKENLNLFN